MKQKYNLLITIVIILSLLNTCLALANYSTKPNETVKNIEVNFPGETRWVEVLEGSGGGGQIEGYLKINIIDKGYNDSPYITLSDERGTIRNFSMTEDEIAKVYVMDKQDGSILRTITIKDPQDNISSEILHIFSNIASELSKLMCLLGISSSC